MDFVIIVKCSPEVEPVVDEIEHMLTNQPINCASSISNDGQRIEIYVNTDTTDQARYVIALAKEMFGDQLLYCPDESEFL